MVERMRRLRMSLASSSPGASGDIARPNYVGPSGSGLVERTKAGESPWNQGCSNGRPCPSPEGGPEDEGKRRSGAPRGAPVRVMDRQVPPAGGTGFAARRATGCGVSHQRLSALRSLTFVRGDVPSPPAKGKPSRRTPRTINRGGEALAFFSLASPAV
jgi:hypothetical protein